MFAMAWLVVAALPALEAPALLLDIETAPSTSNHALLVEANLDGVLYTQIERDGGTALWWSSWDAEAQRIVSLRSGVIAKPLGKGFILFQFDADHVTVAALDVSETPRLTSLLELDGPPTFPSTNRTDGVWWSCSQGTFTTDGTTAGTRQLSTLTTAAFVLGDDLYFVSPGQLRRLENGQLIDPGYRPDNALRAGAHLAIGVPFRTPQNELNERLGMEPDCVVGSGGAAAWLVCARADGGRALLSTDGTPEGTSVRAAGDSFFLDQSSEDYLLFRDGNQQHCLSRFSGTPTDLTFPGCIGPLEAIVGDTVVTPNGVGRLPNGGCQIVGRTEAIRAVGRRPILQRTGEAKFLLTDGTDAGSQTVPAHVPDWPTASSNPALLGSDGINALFSSERGVFMTDGTVAGTRSVGETAAFFGHHVLAFDGEFAIFDEDGGRSSAPAGTVATSGGLLVGRVGCDAFTLDDANHRVALPELGCVVGVGSSDDGALMRNSDGATWLVRAGHAPFALVGEVVLASGVRCAPSACWYVSQRDGVQFANLLTLESGESAPVKEVPEGMRMRLATNFGVVFSHRGMMQTLVRPDGQLEQFDLTGTTADGVLLYTTGSALMRRDASGDNELHRCPEGRLAVFNVAGKRIFVLCGFQLYSGTTEGNFSEFSATPSELTPIPGVPSGSGDLAGISMIGLDWRRIPTRFRFVITDGIDRAEFPGLRGGSLAKVRGGYVFSGSPEFVDDLELWVLAASPPPQRTCGCETSSGALTLAMLVLLRSFRSRKAQGATP